MMEQADREQVQHDWTHDTVQIIVATVAFGMGAAPNCSIPESVYAWDPATTLAGTTHSVLQPWLRIAEHSRWVACKLQGLFLHLPASCLNSFPLDRTIGSSHVLGLLTVA